MKSSKSLLRKGLVIFQFTLTIILICTTLILYKQIKFVSSAELGFDSSDILLIHYQGESDENTGERLKQSLATDPLVKNLTTINTPPGVMTYRFRGLYTDRSLNNRITTRAYYTDHDFFKTFNISLIEGSEVLKKINELPEKSIFISRSLAETLGDKGIVGEYLYSSNEFLQIAGIYDDFVESPISYFGSHGSFVQIKPTDTEYLALKIISKRSDELITGFKKVWSEINPDVPFKYTLLDNDISEGYSGLRGEMKIFFTLSVLTIMMASLGIFGLIGYTAERKTKEIGIRKILGSSTGNIIFMLQKELAYLILIANFIAVPIAIYFSNEFIRYFTIKTEIGYEIYLLTSLSIITVAYISSSYQAIKAARANPIDALRYE